MLLGYRLDGSFFVERVCRGRGRCFGDAVGVVAGCVGRKGGAFGGGFAGGVGRVGGRWWEWWLFLDGGCGIRVDGGVV